MTTISVNETKIEPNSAIKKDIQALEQSALIEMFILDITGLKDNNADLLTDLTGSDPILRFHSGTNQLMNDLVWQGHTYIALPIEAEGFDVSAKGKLPRPKIRIANTIGDANSVFSSALFRVNDLIGAQVTRKRTYLKYLDAINFSGGNSTADPYKEFPEDVFYIEQKTLETRYVIEWDMVSKFDFQGILLPRRQVVQNSCPWKYKGEGCDYGGANGFFTALDQPTSSSSEDTCSKTLVGCKLRFGENNPLPFGGFPGAKRYDGQ